MAVAAGAFRRWKWRAALVGVVIVALVAFVATRGSAVQDEDYRTATVDTGDVTQTLSASGSIESASRYDLAFQVDGTIGTVAVEEGDTVSAGQQIATLDDSDLQDAVDSAQDALTQAEDALADDLDAQASGSTSGSSAGSSSGGSISGGNVPSTTSPGTANPGTTSPGTTNPGTTAPDTTAEQQAVRDAQDALLAQYDVTTAAVAQAKTDAEAAQTVCAAFTALDPTDPTAADALTACQDATATATTSQQAAVEAQSALMDAVTALNTAVTSLLNALADGASTAAPASYTTGTVATATLVSYTSASVATATDGDFSGGASGSGRSSVPSAEDILADRAAVTEAEANLAVAQAQLDYASLATPVAGTVVSVGINEGDSVTAGDTSTAITVVADNTYLVNLSVSLTQARLLQVGQAASLTLLSDNQVVDGTVSSVSNVNSGNSFQQTYAVTIAVPDPGFAIRIGTATRMKITVAQASGVLVVPTSAVSDASGDATVQVIGDDGTPQLVSVTTGAIGAEYTEITGGLEAGQVVVLADLTVKLSTGDDDSTSTGGLLSGLGDDSSSDDQQFQGPGGNFQPPDGFTGGGGFGGPPSG